MDCRQSTRNASGVPGFRGCGRRWNIGWVIFVAEQEPGVEPSPPSPDNLTSANDPGRLSGCAASRRKQYADRIVNAVSECSEVNPNMVEIVRFASTIRTPAVTNAFRQTPNGDGRWRETHFVRDNDERADWLVVYDDLAEPLPTRVPWPQRIVILSEPPKLKRYPLRYLQQFGAVVGPVPVSSAYKGRLIWQHPALLWHYGASWKDGTARGWDDLSRHPVKTRRISVVASGKNWRPEYKARLRFVQKLKDVLGDELDVFGRGIRSVDDKAEAIAPYRYHVVLENNAVDHFWTEKLADAYLGEAFPIYSGGGELARYFDPRSFATIDVSDPEAAVSTVVKVLADDPASRVQPLLQAMHERLMNEHNLFAVCERIVSQAPDRNEPPLPRPVLIHPSLKFSLKRSLHKSWRDVRTRLGLRRGR